MRYETQRVSKEIVITNRLRIIWCSIVEVAKPNLGESKPSQIKADVSITS